MNEQQHLCFRRSDYLVLATRCIGLLVIFSLGGSRTFAAPDSMEVDGVTEFAKGDYSNAFMMFSLGAENGNATSLYNAGICFELGRGTVKDTARAFELYRESAEKGYRYAWRAMGVCYRDGIGVGRDPLAAHAAFTNAANLGSISALADLGAMYLSGCGVQMDEAKAVDFYTKAAEKGDSLSMHNLGELHYFGRHFPKDEAEGCKWFTAGAVGGHVNSIVWVVSLSDAGSTNVAYIGMNDPWRIAIQRFGLRDVTDGLTEALKSHDDSTIERMRAVVSQRCYSFTNLK